MNKTDKKYGNVENIIYELWLWQTVYNFYNCCIFYCNSGTLCSLTCICSYRKTRCEQLQTEMITVAQEIGTEEKKDVISIYEICFAQPAKVLKAGSKDPC